MSALATRIETHVGRALTPGEIFEITRARETSLQFRKDVAHLASMYQQHIRVEESVVFPLAARMLSHADKMAMAEEMAGRRKVKLVTELS